MNGRYLLDTNVAIRILNQELDLRERSGSGLEIFLSFTVIGELLFGVEKSREATVNRTKVDRLIDLCPVVPLDLVTARHYARLKAALRDRGRPIPENDLWIAAAAFQHDLILVTRDRHFEQVANLQLEGW